LVPESQPDSRLGPALPRGQQSTQRRRNEPRGAVSTRVHAPVAGVVDAGFRTELVSTSSRRSSPAGPRSRRKRGRHGPIRARQRSRSQESGSHVVELVGPAGAGKSTLAGHVQQDDSRVHVGLSLWGLPRSRLVRGAIALAPTIVIAALRKRRLRWREIKQMIRLDALRRVLRRMKSRHPIILLDEGPVFGISWLDLTFADRGAAAPKR